MQRSRRNILGAAGVAVGFAAGVLLLEAVLPPRGRSPQDAAGAAPDIFEVEAAPPAGEWDASLGSVPRFRDITRQAGISFLHVNGVTGKFHYPEVMGAGVVLFDHDGDGLLDLYFLQGNRLLEAPSAEIANKLYHNNGDGTFTDRTREAGLADAGFGQGGCSGDYDGDGDADLFITNFGPDKMYRNEGDGTFIDVTAAAGLEDPRWDGSIQDWGQACSFLDFDNDGDLDLYVQNYLTYDLSEDLEAYVYIGDRKALDYPAPTAFPGQADHLYRNGGDGTFTDVTKAAGMYFSGGRGMGCACFDFDDDGFTDIFVSNDTMANYLFHNRGDGTFEETALAAGVAFGGRGVPEASMGVDIGDHDGDGRIDMIVPCVWGQVFSLYRNMGSYFTDVSFRAGLARPTSSPTGFSPKFLDYDNDGDLDLFFSTGGVRMGELASPDSSYRAKYGMRDILLANDGGGRYRSVSALAGPHFKETTIGRGAAAGDLDNDGDLDIVVSNLGGRPAVLRNDTEGGHWITLRLVGRGGNRDAVGASVVCTSGGRSQRSIVHSRVTYLSQSDRRVHFGLGASAVIDRLEIRWPDGKRQALENVAADRFLVIRRDGRPDGGYTPKRQVNSE